jgi:hypothetical protein
VPDTTATAVGLASALRSGSPRNLGALFTRHRADDSVNRAITRIIRADLIVVDDLGMLPIGDDAAEGFYRLVDAVYERRSVAVTSNLHPSGFDELMTKPWPPHLSTGCSTTPTLSSPPPIHSGSTEATAGKGVRPLN